MHKGCPKSAQKEDKMQKFTQKQLKQIGGAEAFAERLSAWQKEHNTTGLPRASQLDLECIGYSVGVYGCNGSLFRDLSTGELFGLGSRGYHIYIR